MAVGKTRFVAGLLSGALMLAGEAGAQSTRQPGAEVKPLYGNISPFYGNISPFYGNISPFYGNISPFWGNISPFWGNISPFYGNISPFWGNISPFGEKMPADGVSERWNDIGGYWTTAGAKWGRLSASWGNISPFAPSVDYTPVAQDFAALVSDAETFWGAAVTAQTGQSFTDGFAAPLLARHGLSLSDPASFAKLDAAARSRFFLDWYDGLMAYSGADRVDHWMKTANWNPRLTQIAGSGGDAVIGIIDFNVKVDADLAGKVSYAGGSAIDNGHGVGVGSLIVASHDGKGVMGIAPSARVLTYNPFDSTGTASWSDVTNGIAQVAQRGATVVNLSLGVPGWALHGEWRTVFTDKKIESAKDKTLYIIAAGNDGIAQTRNVNMKDAFDTTFIVVGSVDPNGEISSFSNRPGNACVTEDGKCENLLKDDDYFKKSGYLKNRFIVAPGELILVSDGAGGTVRRSGTSFAAPLVSGAVALIQDRWPWLREKPREIASILLRSARDLGAPGVDEVYGVGLLDVEASQSPLDFSKLKYYLVENGNRREVSVSTLRSTSSATLGSWETKGLYFSAFEKIISEERDFLIPLSSRLVGSRLNGGEYFQDYVYNRMVSWMGTRRLMGQPRMALTDIGGGAPIALPGAWSMAFSGQMRRAFAPSGQSAGLTLDSAVTMTSPNGALGFSMGRGAGAVLAGSASGFAMRSDFDPETGGANPLLGFASGGAHAAMQWSAVPGVKVSVAMTENDGRLNADTQRLGGAFGNAGLLGLRNYGASAVNTSIGVDVSRALSVTAGYTRLEERGAFLGTRSLDAGDFGAGTRSHGLTLSATAQLPGDIAVSIAANRVQPAAASGASALRPEGVVASSYQVNVSKLGVFGGDFARLSLARPLAVTNGRLDFASVQVIDRSTGEQGLVTQSSDLTGGPRRLVAEGLYGRSLLGSGQISLFARGELRDTDERRSRFLAGVRGSLAF